LDELPGYHALFTFEPRLRRQSQFNARLQLSMARIAEVDRIAAAIEREVLRPTAGSLFAAVSQLMRIIVTLSREYSLLEHAESLGMLRLGDVLTFIEGNYERAITVDDLARLAHVSQRSLFRAFQAALGRSPLEYVLQSRLRRASELLRDTEEKLDEIAERIRCLGAFAPGSFTAFAALSAVKEENGRPKAMQMVANLAADQEIVSDLAQKVIEAAEASNDQATVDLVVRRMDVHQKHAWMLRSHME